MDHCLTPNGHFRLILLYIYIFYSRNNTDWIANVKIGLNPNNSVIKRLRCSKLDSIGIEFREQNGHL